MEEDSGICSPPLWPPDSPVKFNNPRLLSPSSRAQAIARGQREIMEMVENMPETSYELSLKDIVEQRRDLTENSVDETQSMEEGEERSILGGGGQTDSQRWRKNKKGSVKRQESSNKTGRIIVKNGSLNHNKGLLINMFFPFSIGSKKNNKKKSSITTSSSFGNNIASAKLSPELLEKSSGGGGGGDRRDGWWKKLTGSSDSESLRVTSSSSESTGRSGSSGSSGSSTAGSLHSNSTRNNSNCSHGCWSFFPSKKRKS